MPIGTYEGPFLGGLMFSPESLALLKGRMPSGGLINFGGFGLSNIRVGMSGEIEKARLDILERMKRTTESRAKSRLTLPRLFGDGKTEKNILADIL